MDDPDHVLVARLAAGDDDAIGEVFDRYGAFVFGIAKGVSRSLTTAEEVVQDVLTGLWRNPTGFDQTRGSLRTYLGVQAHRRAIDALRGDARRKAREERRYSFDLFTSSRGCDESDSATVAEVIRQAISRLPAEQRRVVELAFWDGYTHRQVAEVLGIPEGTAKSRLRLAQAKLSQSLASFQVETV